MTTTYDSTHPLYLDEAATRHEMSRVFDVCQSCRRCVDRCAAFPTLFELIERHDDHDAGRLTPAEQDVVVGSCHQCSMCSVGCPYTGDRHEADVDVPRLMLRAKAMQVENGHAPPGTRRAIRWFGRPDRLGRLATSAAGVVNRLLSSSARSPIRRMLNAVTGVSSVRFLSSFATERFSTWFARRPRVTIGHPYARVTVFPTCVVEYQAVGIGHDLVRVYERNGLECALSDATCCGAPLLHAGSTVGFQKVAARTVRTLADDIRSGTDVVVAQPTCSQTIRRHYVDHVPESLRDDAALVAEHTYDAVEYLMRLHRSDDAVLDTDFDGSVPDVITLLSPSHLRAQEIGSPARDLLRLTGARVRVVDADSGSEGLWSMRGANDGLASELTGRLVRRVGVGDDHRNQDANRDPDQVVVGDCHLTNTAVGAQLGRVVDHPLEFVVRAYGIAAGRGE